MVAEQPGDRRGAEPDDIFGEALAAGDFNGDGRADLAIGAPGENSFAGVVHVLYGSGTGLAAAGSQLWSQNSPGIADVAEDFDVFGETLAAGTLSIGSAGTANPAATSPPERSRTARDRRP